ncbi:hypothetical protein CR513_47326, partial [Mucuna pruriens]
MEHFNNNDLEYLVDDYFDDSDFEGEDSSDIVPQPTSDQDSDFEDFPTVNFFINHLFLTALNHFMDQPTRGLVLQQSNAKTDTTASEARSGKDIQGIPWERLNYNRNQYRETRLNQYKNYENLSRSRHDPHQVTLFSALECFKVHKGNTFYDFHFNTRLVKSTIVHFQITHTVWNCDCLISTLNKYGQAFFKSFLFLLAFLLEIMNRSCIRDVACLPYHVFLFLFSCWMLMSSIYFLSGQLRNLLWATSKHDVYLMQNYSVMHWSALLRRGKEVLNVAKPIIPTLKHPGSLAQPVSRVQISTMTVKENLMVAGGFQGELICKNLKHPGVLFCGKITTDDNAITNAVDVYRNPVGSLRVITANNDSQVRVFDAENFATLGCFKFDWSVNNTSVSPDGKLLAVLGDSTECLIADANTGKITGSLKGHLDYSFASAWHPDGRILATGNQDTTCRLWDIRKLSQSMGVLKGRMGAIRALSFTSDGRFLAMAEPADFVHIFDSHSGYVQGQEIDLFGEIAGISFSPDTEALFVAIADRTYGSLLEFTRKRYNKYLYSMF